MMKWLFGVWMVLVLVSAVVPCAIAADGASGNVGVGVFFGEPTGLTYKQWRGGSRAFDAGLAYSFSEFLLIYVDHLWHFPGWVSGTPMAKSQGQRWMPYIGLGGLFVLSTQGARNDSKLFLDRGSSIGLGVRVPFGLEWLPTDPLLGVYLELVPGVGLAPSVDGFFQGGLGIRYYFQ